jgi:hypothetical protein
MHTFRELHLVEKVAASAKSVQLENTANWLITANNSDHRTTGNDNDRTAVNVLDDGSTK